jgi:hypothetical protein
MRVRFSTKIAEEFNLRIGLTPSPSPPKCIGAGRYEGDSALRYEGDSALRYEGDSALRCEGDSALRY